MDILSTFDFRLLRDAAPGQGGDGNVYVTIPQAALTLRTLLDQEFLRGQTAKKKIPADQPVASLSRLFPKVSVR